MGKRGGGWDGFRDLKQSDIVNGKIVTGLQKEAYNKEHNIRCEFDGIKFASKQERDYYKNNLLPRFQRGQVKWFLLQVPFRCGGGVTYRCDFLEVWMDGSIHIIDVKGRRTPVFINKKKQVEALYPIRIECVKG